jgi:hypothetical protein
VAAVRRCECDGAECLFHGFFQRAWTHGSGALTGSFPAGQEAFPVALVEYPDGTVGQVPALDVRMLDASDAEFDLFDASEDCDVVMTTVGDVRRAYFSGFGDGANDEWEHQPVRLKGAVLR